MREQPSNDDRTVETVLAVDGFKARVTYLSARPGLYSPELVAALLRRANRDMRRDPREAAQCARLARLVVNHLGDDEASRLACMRTLAQAYTLQGRFPASIKVLDAALGLATDAARAAEIEMLQIPPLVHLERYEEARAKGARCMAHFESIGDDRARMRTHVTLADLAFRTDEPREALGHYAAARELIPQDASPRLFAVVAANCANALEARNRFHAAARHFELAQRLLADEDCEHTLAQVGYNAAYLEVMRGNYDRALQRYAELRPVFKKLRDDRHLAHVDLDCAEVHVHLHMPEEAARLATLAETRFIKLNLAKEAAQSAQLAGRAAELAGNPDEAKEHLTRAAEAFGGLDLKERQLSCLTQIASIVERHSDAGDVREQVQNLVAQMDRGVGPVNRASAELLLARVELAEGRWTEALDRAGRVLDRCRRIHAPWLHIEAHRTIARAHDGRNQLPEAVLAYKRAIDALENYRGGVPPDEYMAAFLAGRSDLYHEIVDVLVRAKEIDLAFEFTEQAKSRALVDLLADRHDFDLGIERASLTERKLHSLRERLNAIYHRIFQGNASGDARGARAIRQARQAAAALESRMGDILRKARMETPEWTSLQAAETLSLETVREALEPDVTLVEYFLAGEQLFTFVVTSRGVRVVKQDVKSTELRRLLERFHFHLAKYGREHVVAEELVLQATRANLAKLADVLIRPIESDLETDRIVIIPHGLLHKIPFHALPRGDGWLSDRFEVLYAPSAAVYVYCRRRGRPVEGPACIFGLPDSAAPQIEDEVRCAADMLGSDKLFLRNDATLDVLRTEAPRARILHIATHGMFRREQPMLSSIRLADTWLNLYDIYGLKVGGELVVLSTCESGIAGVTDGDEILGLTRGFLYAGARAILASQWPVSDATTTVFMKHFYRELQSSNNAVAAHRAAMARVRETHPHPYFWAPFFLTGCPVAHMRHDTQDIPNASAELQGATA